MKRITIEANIFEKGDYVMTPDGYGIVLKDEEHYKTLEQVRWDGDVLVQHKSGLSGNPSNKPKEMERDLLISKSEEEYDGGE